MPYREIRRVSIQNDREGEGNRNCRAGEKRVELTKNHRRSPSDQNECNMLRAERCRCTPMLSNVNDGRKRSEELNDKKSPVSVVPRQPTEHVSTVTFQKNPRNQHLKQDQPPDSRCKV
jgi:hypothetical protein